MGSTPSPIIDRASTASLPLLLLCGLSAGCSDSADPGPAAPDASTPTDAGIDPGPCHAPSTDEVVTDVPDGQFVAPRSDLPIEVDGCSRDPVWADQDWYGLSFVWMGADPSPTDYQGRFKAAWTEDRLALLVEVVDDTLHPTLADGLANFWKGDYVEVFLDEDQSGGDHRYNHQAFAYHVSTEGRAIDQSTARAPVFFDDHVEVVRTNDGDRYLWEMTIQVFGDDFDEDSATNTPVVLSAGKVLGFSLAYGDNDGNQSRENFMGSRQTHGNNNDDGYINADVFGSLRLME